MVIGLTGGLGCGKSTATAAFAARGFATADADRIVRENVLTDAAVLALAKERWGDGVIAREGGLDRAVVAGIVFTAEAERRWWEGVIHPRVRAIWRGRVAAAPQADWVVEVPLLFEAGLEKGFDFIVCVGANAPIQLARVTARGMSQAQAGLRIASQYPLEKKLKSSHAILWNDGDQTFLDAQVDRLAERLRTRLGAGAV
jgi:dephospho-CoA kinase